MTSIWSKQYNLTHYMHGWTNWSTTACCYTIEGIAKCSEKKTKRKPQQKQLVMTHADFLMATENNPWFLSLSAQ